MAIVLLFLVIPVLFGGEPAGTGSISGVVLDPSEAPIPGVRVALTTAAQVSAGVATSDVEGRFRIGNLPLDSYILTANKSGFAEFRTAIKTTGDAQLTIRLSLSSVQSEVTVSAETSHVEFVDRIAQPVSVISQEELHKRAVTTLTEAADGEAGVQSLKTSPTLGAIFVRGLAGKNVSVYRDGVRYNTSAQRGGISTFLNLLEPESLDGVEVLRGPNSAQYGSDSLGGSVSVISRAAAMNRSGRKWGAQISPMYQSASNAFGSGTTVDYGGEKFGFSTSLAGRRVNTLRTGGGLDSHAAVTRFLGLPSNILGGRLPDTAFTSYGGSFHGQVWIRPVSQLIVHYERSQQDGGKRYDQLLGGDGNWIADLRNLMLDFGYLRYQHFNLGPFDQASVTASYNTQREERVNQGGQGNSLASISHQYERTKAWGTQFYLDKRLSRGELLFGGEGYAERIVAPSFNVSPASGAVTLARPRVPDGARYLTHGLYTQAHWQPQWKAMKGDRLRLSGAVRFGGASYNSRASRSPVVNGRPLWPDDSLSASAVTGRGGAVFWILDTLAVHGHYSRGFRVPNVTDLAGVGLQGNGQFEAAVADLAGRGATIGDRADDQARSTAIPVAHLRPEKSDNVDFGARIRTSRWQADFTGFWMRLDSSVVSQTLILPPGATGQPLGDQIISRQLPSGAVFVPLSVSPVLVRANYSGARLRGFEHMLKLRLSQSWSLSENLTYIRAGDAVTGLPPDIEPGVPPLTMNPVVSYAPGSRRFWVELYSNIALRQDRLSSLALSDRRIGNPRSRANIQSFFNNGARTRGLVDNGILLATGETLAQVQSRVLGTLNSAPQFTAIPGYGVLGLRGGLNLGEKSDMLVDFSNIGDKNYRGIGWGVDGAGRSVTIRIRHRL